MIDFLNQTGIHRVGEGAFSFPCPFAVLFNQFRFAGEWDVYGVGRKYEKEWIILIFTNE